MKIQSASGIRNKIRIIRPTHQLYEDKVTILWLHGDFDNISNLPTDIQTERRLIRKQVSVNFQIPLLPANVLDANEIYIHTVFASKTPETT